MRGITSKGGGLGIFGGSVWHFKLCSTGNWVGVTLNRACLVSEPKPSSWLPKHFDGLNECLGFDSAGHLLLAYNGLSKASV